MTEFVYIREKFLVEDENIKSVINSRQKYIDTKMKDLQQTKGNLSTQLDEIKTDVEAINRHDFEDERVIHVGEPLQMLQRKNMPTRRLKLFSRENMRWMVIVLRM